MSDLLPILSIVLVGGRLASSLALRFGLPGVFGELLLGLAVGPVIVSHLHGDGSLGQLGQLGVIFLMLLVGLETDLSVVSSVGAVAFVVACLGAILPVVFGFAAATLLGEPPRVAFFIGVALSATSVSITAATLRELGKLNGVAGRTIMVAAVLDDVLVLVLVSLVGSQNGDSPVLAVGKLLAFLVVAVGGGALLLRPVLTQLEKHVEEFLAVAVGLALLYAWLAESFAGLAGMTGAYIAGLLLARAMPHQPLAKGVETMATGFFATLFFVSLGLNVQIARVDPAAVAGLTAVAIATKLIGCGGGARLCGLDRRESLAVGIGMIPRGEVALIVASIGLERGILGGALFSDLVLVVMVTTLVTPVLLKAVFAAQERAPRRRPVLTPALAGGLVSSEGSD